MLGGGQDRRTPGLTPGAGPGGDQFLMDPLGQGDRAAAVRQFQRFVQRRGRFGSPAGSVQRPAEVGQRPGRLEPPGGARQRTGGLLEVVEAGGSARHHPHRP